METCESKQNGQAKQEASLRNNLFPGEGLDTLAGRCTLARVPLYPRHQLPDLVPLSAEEAAEARTLGAFAD